MAGDSGKSTRAGSQTPKWSETLPPREKTVCQLGDRPSTLIGVHMKMLGLMLAGAMLVSVGETGYAQHLQDADLVESSPGKRQNTGCWNEPESADSRSMPPRPAAPVEPRVAEAR